jgi:alkanesulfonate monooxygenase SsuD/methylene tetrahydromethanopterin reductase-like flavin-dependent oxidoreductase (luciferase family)
VARKRRKYLRYHAGRIARAARHGRTIDFGLRIHVVVRETEEEARAWTRRLMSKFDAQQAEALKQRAQDANSLGVVRQNEMRREADDEGFVEPILWTGIGRARSGAGGALVGNARANHPPTKPLHGYGHPVVHFLGLSTY